MPHDSIPLRRKIAYLAVAIGVTAVLVFVAGEIFVRIFVPQPDTMRWLAPSERYGHVMKSNFEQRYRFLGTDTAMQVQTNSLGLRDEEWTPPGDPSAKTILCIGDSFTFGQGVDVDDRFDTVLERKLDEADESFQLVNAGVNAWGTIQATRYARDHFETFEPDIIVLTFCENDPSDDAYFLKKGQSFDEFTFPGKTFLRDHSHFYRFVNYRLFQLLHAFYTKPEKKPAEAPVEAATPAPYVSDEQWESSIAVLDEFYEDFRAFNPTGKLLIQANAPWDASLASHLKAFCEKRDGVRYVDLAWYIDGAAEEELRLSYDPHWSPRMHEISGTALFDALTNLQIAKNVE